MDACPPSNRCRWRSCRTTSPVRPVESCSTSANPTNGSIGHIRGAAHPAGTGPRAHRDEIDPDAGDFRHLPTSGRSFRMFEYFEHVGRDDAVLRGGRHGRLGGRWQAGRGRGVEVDERSAQPRPAAGWTCAATAGSAPLRRPQALPRGARGVLVVVPAEMVMEVAGPRGPHRGNRRYLSSAWPVAEQRTQVRWVASAHPRLGPAPRRRSGDGGRAPTPRYATIPQWGCRTRPRVGPRSLPAYGSRRVRSLRGRRAHRHGGHGGQRRVAPAALRRDRHRSRPPNPLVGSTTSPRGWCSSPEPRPLLPWVTCSSTSAQWVIAMRALVYRDAGGLEPRRSWVLWLCSVVPLANVVGGAFLVREAALVDARTNNPRTLASLRKIWVAWRRWSTSSRSSR